MNYKVIIKIVAYMEYEVDATDFQAAAVKADDLATDARIPPMGCNPLKETCEVVEVREED